MRRKLLLGVVAALLLTPTVLLYFVASTQAGLAFIAGHLGKIGSMTITAGQVTGTFVGGFNVKSLRVQHRLADIQAEDIHGRVRLWPLLLQRQVVLDAFSVRQVAVQLLDPPDDQPRGTPRFLPPTLRIDIDAARVDAATITLLSGRPVELAGISAGVTILPTEIRILGGKLDYDFMHLAADARLRAANPLRLAGEGTVAWDLPNQPAWQIATRFDGDLEDLPLTAEISQPFHASIKGQADLLGGWGLTGDAAVRDLDLTAFGGGSALGIITAQLTITADADGYTARGPFTAPGLKAGPMQLQFNGAYAERRLTIHEASVVHASGAHATARGTVDIIDNGPRLALSGDWSNFRWPLTGAEPAFTSPRGHYRLEGVKRWQVEGEAEVITAGLPVMPATVKGVLDPQSFTIAQGSVQLLGGNAAFKGEARWQPAETWQIDGRMTGLDTTQLRADVQGRLNFDFQARGAPFGEAGTIDFTLARLSGNVRGQSADGKGHFSRASGSADWQFDAVDVHLGRTHIQLDGGLGAAPNLTFAVDADDLSLFDPTARGRLIARGRYAGTADAPVLLFKARGNEFEWNGFSVAALDADVDIDASASGHTNGVVDITGLQRGVRTLQKVRMELSGNGELQRIVMDIDAAPLRTALSAEGTLQDGVWRGRLQSLGITDGAELSMRMTAPTPLVLSASRLEAGMLCLTDVQAKLCATGSRTEAGVWATAFSAESLPLRALTAGLTQNINYEGLINVYGQLTASPSELPTGSVTGQLTDAQLRHQLSSGRDERLALGSGRVSATATATGFNVDVGLDAGRSGSIRGELRGDRNTPDWQDYPIRGALDARTDGLALLDIYVGGIDKATGQLSTRVDIAGTLGRPELSGLLQLRDAEIDIYQINLALRALSLDARFNNTTLDLTGQSQLGQGTAKFNGKLSWRDSEPFGDLHVEGERLLIVDVPEAHIEASPKLDFKLAGRRIDASGEVAIPRAKITPADLTNAVLPSGDEVLVGAPEVDPKQRWIVVSNIRLSLGEAVDIDSLGLTARLGGGIQVRTDEGGSSRGQGELNITSGKYMALGRLLDIERGRLIFNNVPLGDPGVDLRAQKVFPDVTAGINVRGALRAPRLTFYSEPSIPQSQIASLILAGGSLESVQDTQRSGAARNDLLAQGGAILAQRVGSRVGVDDVGIESDPANTDSSLVLGKYLSPRLYISYGISLAEAINTLKLRYTIGDRWTIKTEAGRARSADIVYTFKKK
ncbi:MAG: translocation/assembly module TamB domain-containing protein [Steroidobacteraceae bacterium]